MARHLAGDKEVTDANRDAYRELARAGIMVSVGTFIKGDDCVFQLTHRGWERRERMTRGHAAGRRTAVVSGLKSEAGLRRATRERAAPKRSAGLQGKY